MRLFVAVDLPDVVKDRLVAFKTDIPTARWTNRHQMHITLFFLGETDRMAEVRAALEGVQANPFDLSLAGVGRFPGGSRRPPRVLWAGIDAPPELARLQARVVSALAAVGFEPDTRPFSPHITLARLKAERTVPAAAAFIERHTDFRAGPVHVDRFTLYASQLTPHGSRYTVQAQYPLLGGR